MNSYIIVFVNSETEEREYYPIDALSGVSAKGLAINVMNESEQDWRYEATFKETAHA